MDSKVIKQFQGIWEKEFGEEISTEQALIQEKKLITLIKIIAQYIEKREEKNENQNKATNEPETLEK